MRGIANGWLGGMLLVSACQVAPPPATWSAPQGAEGSVALASGATVRWSLHHDRNALRDSRLVGDSLVAIAQAGTLLRFDAETLELTAERCEPVRCLGTGPDDELLAGLAGGRIVQVESRTLACREVAKVAGELAFVGRDRRGLVAVTVVLERREVADGAHTLLWEMPAFTVHDLASGRTASFRPELAFPMDTVSAWLLDSRQRLWLGFDMGEWDGHWVCVDLERLEVRDGKCRALHGFLEAPRGRVLAFGGIHHLAKSAFVAPMTDRGMHPALFTYRDPPESPDENATPASLPSTPVHPIAAMLADPEQGGYFVFSLRELWRVDLDFRQWTKLADLKASNVRGRPHVEEAAPELCAAYRRSGRTLELFATTHADGIWRMRDTQQACSTQPGQLPVTRIASVLACEYGAVLVGEGPTTVWRRTRDAWQRVQPELTRRDEHARILVDRQGALVAATSNSVFATPEHTWWRVAGSKPPFTLHRLQDDTWEPIGTAEIRLRDAHTVNSDGPPWWVQNHPHPRLDEEPPTLARLAPSGADDWQLTPLCDAAGRRLEVRDAVALDTHSLLLATPDGVRRLACATGAITPADEPMPEGSMRALCHDRAGRLWIAGDDRVWVRDGATLHDLGPVQPLGFQVQTMIADPETPTGVVMVLRGGLAAWVALEPDAAH